MGDCTLTLRIASRQVYGIAPVNIFPIKGRGVVPKNAWLRAKSLDVSRGAGLGESE